MMLQSSPARERVYVSLAVSIDQRTRDGETPDDQLHWLIGTSSVTLLNLGLAMLEAVSDTPKRHMPLEPLRSFYVHAHATFKKLLYHVQTIHLVGNAPTIKVLEHDRPFLDWISAVAIARLALETTVVFRYIFIRDGDDAKVFWHRTWTLYGHSRREGLARVPTSGGNKQPLAETYPADLQSLHVAKETCKGYIEATRSFQELHPLLQQASLRGEWTSVGNPIRLNKKGVECTTDLSILDIARNLGFKEADSAKIYKIGCSFVHTDGMGIDLVMREGSDPSMADKMFEVAIGQSLRYFASALEGMLSLWPTLDTLPQTETAYPFLRLWLDINAREGTGHPPVPRTGSK